MTLIKAMAWPVVVLICVLVLKKQIGHLIGRLTHFSGPAGVSADFGQQAEAANELAEAITPKPADDLPTISSSHPEVRIELKDGRVTSVRKVEVERTSLTALRASAQVHPVGAIIEAWNVVEAAIRQAFPTSRHPAATGRTANLIGREISGDLGALASRLGALRNQAVHGLAVPTTEEALDFVNAAWRLASALFDHELLWRTGRESDDPT